MTLEELYYIVTGIQYPVTPLLITERQWQITGITTPVIFFFHILRREVVNHWFSCWTTPRTYLWASTSEDSLLIARYY